MRKPKKDEPMTLLRCETCGRESLSPTRYVEALGWLYCSNCPKLPAKAVWENGVPVKFYPAQPVSKCYSVEQTKEATP